MSYLRLTLILFFIAGAIEANAKRNARAFAVTTAGDTVKLPASAWIVVHKHPQLLVYKDSVGKKWQLPASDLRLLDLPTAVQSFANGDGPAFVTRPIPAGEEGDCWHFVQEIYRHDSAVIYRDASCERCQRTNLYVQRRGGGMEKLDNDNYREVLQRYLPQHSSIIKERNRRQYFAPRVEATIWRLRKQS